MARKKTVKSETTTQNTLSAAEETMLKGIEEYVSINIPGIGDFKVRHYDVLAHRGIRSGIWASSSGYAGIFSVYRYVLRE